MPDSIMPRQTMSGLDFPANPNVGDQFMGWTWDGTKWIRTPVIPPAQLMVSVGPSPPGSPADGFLWWDSVGGNLYMWYVDATSSQWVIANVGIMGPTGAQGPPGPAVPAVNLEASVPTAADLPTTGNTAGDARITVDTGDLWVWDGTVWFNAGPIQGPPGVAGAPGPQGPAGPPGPVGEAPTDGQYYVRQGSTASWSPLETSLTGFLPLSGGLMTSAADISCGGSLATLPGNTLGGVVLGRVAVGATNLNIACYPDTGAQSRQLPGTGSTSVAPINPGIIGTNGGNINLFLSPIAADNALLTLTNVGTFGMTTASVPGTFATTGLSVGGLQLITNASGFLALGQSVIIPANASYGCGVPGSQVSWANNQGYFYSSSTILGGGGLACGAPGNVTTWSNNQGYMYCPNSLSVFSIVVGNGLAGAATFWSFNAGYMFCESSVMANAFVQGSDPSLKKDIVDAESGALKIVNSIPVKRYRFKTDEASSPLHAGFLATDVAKVHSDAVITTGRGRANPDDPVSDEKIQSIDTTHMNAILWKAVQELAAKVAALEAR